MAAPMTASMPPYTELGNGCTIEFVAIDPTTGNAVSGVVVSNASWYLDTSGDVQDLAYGPFMLVPGPEA